MNSKCQDFDKKRKIFKRFLFYNVYKKETRPVLRKEALKLDVTGMIKQRRLCMKSKMMWKRMGMLGLSTMMAFSSVAFPVQANTGQPVEETTRETQIRNVALDGTAEVSCITDDNGHLRGPEHINDGDVSTGSYWDSGISDEEVYAILDLKQDYDITEINLITYWGRVWIFSFSSTSSCTGEIFTGISFVAFPTATIVTAPV